MPKNAAEFADPYDVEDLDALDDAADPPSPEVQALLDCFQQDLDAALHAQAQDGRDPKDAAEPNAQLRHIQETLNAAKALADGLDYPGPEQRQEFAIHAAGALLDAVHAPKDPSSDAAENRQHADHLAVVAAALADRLSVYDTGGRSEMDSQTAFAIQFLTKGTDLEQADGYFSSYARLQSHRREGPLGTSPEFLPERYQHEAFTPRQQSLLDNAFHALQEHFPNTAACPSMNYQSIDDLLERGAALPGAGDRHQALWRELKLVFDNQEFSSRNEAQDTAAAIAAEIMQNSFPAADPAQDAAPELQRLERDLAQWLCAERPEFLARGRENFQHLSAAMSAAESAAAAGLPAAAAAAAN